MALAAGTASAFFIGERVVQMPSKVRKRGADSYLLTVSIGYDGLGRQQVETKTIKASSMREAQKAYYKFEAEVLQGQAGEVRKNITFKEFAAIWLKDHCAVRLAPKTLIDYQKILDQRLLPRLGHRPLNSISGYDVQLLINELLTPTARLDNRDKPVTGHLAKKVYQVLSAMFNVAIKWDYADSNPCAKIDPPKVIKNARPIMERDELMLALEYSKQEGTFFCTIFHLAIFSGLRIGEICGLQWVDINFEDQYIVVAHTAQYIPGSGNILKDPKSDAGKRMVSLPGFLVQLLLLHKEEQQYYKEHMGTKWHEQGMVFPTWEGEILHTNTLYHWFQDFCAKYNLTKMPFHSLRHTAGTLALALGEDANTVAKRMGHSDATVTMNIYGHYMSAADRALANKMDQFVNNNGEL